MQQQPLFVHTSQGYVNLARVLYIRKPERGLVRFVFSEKDYIELPEAEARRVEHIMVGELFVFPE